MNPCPCLSIAFASTLIVAAPAQDMVAVGWNGGLHALHSGTGELDQLGLGSSGQNALARDDRGILWTTARVITPLSFTHYLSRLDAVAGTVTHVWPTPDLRGLAPAGNGDLWAVETPPAGAPSVLWRIDPVLGTQTQVGSLGVAAVQSLAVQGGVLYGWHWVMGLIVINPANGRAADPYAAGAGNLIVQWLAAHPSGGLLGGTSDGLYRIDTATGIATQVAVLPPGAELRGAEFAAFALPFGQGCDLGHGELWLRARGTLAPGGLVTLESRNHVPGSLRAVAIGFGRDAWAGNPLPLLLDPLLGTSGCSLYVRVDVSHLILASNFPTSVMQVPLVFPARVGVLPLDVFVQHFDLNLPWQPPGSSNALMLHLSQ